MADLQTPKEIKVSVIIPVYNSERFLVQCLDSVLSQTLKELEVICVNDASTDGSREILREYEGKDKRIKVIDFTENKGASAARNAGIKAAKGQFVAVLDSDDWVEEELYERLYKVASSSDDIDGCYCNMTKINRDNKVRCDTVDYTDREDRSDIFIFCYRPYHWQCFYRSEFLRRMGILYPENVRLSEDAMFTVQCFLSARRIVKVPYYGYNYRQTEINSLSRALNPTGDLLNLDALDVLPRELARLGLAGKYKEKEDFFGIWFLVYKALWTVNSFVPPQLDYLRAIQKEIRCRYPHYRRNKDYRRIFSVKKRFLLNFVLGGDLGIRIYLFMLRIGMKLRVKSVMEYLYKVKDYRYACRYVSQSGSSV